MRVRNHTNPFQCLQSYGHINWNQVFNESVNGIDFEIGVGRGIFIQQYAQKHPERKIVGLEVRKILASTLEESIKLAGIKNVKIYYGNGVRFLNESILLPILDRVFIFHPDPWPKPSHHKRRVIQPDFLNQLASRMKPDGRIYFSTDNELLWNDTIPILENSLFSWVKDDPFWSEDYTTHWHRFSVRDGRKIQQSTWQLRSRA